MKQKVLTEKQHEILGRLEKILKEAKENHIGFIYDTADFSVTAYNAENVEDCYYAYSNKPKEDNESWFDWDCASIIENFDMDYTNSNVDETLVVFK